MCRLLKSANADGQRRRLDRVGSELSPTAPTTMAQPSAKVNVGLPHFV